MAKGIGSCLCSELVVCKQHLGQFIHEKKSKKKDFSQVSTPLHIAELFRDLANKTIKQKRGWGINEKDWVIDIACGAGALLIPWKEKGCVMIGADLDEEALEICKRSCPAAILYKHNSLQCKTPCSTKEHLFYNGFKIVHGERWREELSRRQGQKFKVLNPPYENKLPMQFLLKACGEEQENED